MRNLFIMLFFLSTLLGSALPSHSFPVVPPVEVTISLTGTVTSGAMVHSSTLPRANVIEFSGGDVRIVLTYSLFPDQTRGTTTRVETWFDTGQGSVSYKTSGPFEAPVDGGNSGGDTWSAMFGQPDSTAIGLFLYDDSGTIVSSNLDPLTAETNWGKFLDETTDVAKGEFGSRRWTEPLSDFPQTGRTEINAHFEITDIEPIPEPGTMLLLGMNLVGFAVWGKKRLKAG